MIELSRAILLLIAAAMVVILATHGWPGLKAKASAVFLGQPRPDLVGR